MPRYYDPLSMVDNNGDETIQLNPDHGNITLGGAGQDGDLSILNRAGNLTIHMNGLRGSVILGGEREDGDLTLRNSNNDTAIHLSGNSGDGKFGGRGVNGDVSVYNTAGDRTIHLQGGSGQIRVNGEALDVPDYVFEGAYRLDSLESVREHLALHHHLPGIPSAAKIQQEGLELVGFSLGLLKKIEELTLHVITQNEKIRSLQEQMERLADANVR